MLRKSKEKAIGTYLKLVDSLVKPVILHACDCWGDSMKKEILASKFEQFLMSICKQILGVKNLPTISRFYQNSEEHGLK